MLSRIPSLVAFLALACAGVQAHVPERSLLHQGEIRSSAKTAPRGLATKAEQAAKEKSLASVCCIEGNWRPPRKPTLGFCVYAYANPNRYIDPTGKYAEAGHYYTTYYVALRAGFSNEEAQKLAFYSQLPDEVDDLDAIGAQADTLGIRLVSDTLLAVQPSATSFLFKKASKDQQRWRNDIQQGLHSLTGGMGSNERERTLKAIEATGGDIATTGLLIHRLADTYAHCPGGGKCFETGGGHWKEHIEPDTIQSNPEDYLQYAKALVGVLAKQKGMNGEAIEELQAAVAKDLEDVAGIEKKMYAMPMGIAPPGGRFAGGQADIHVLYGRRKPWADSELEKLSVEQLKAKLDELGGDLKYTPENLPGGWSEFAVLVPYFAIARTSRQALIDFENNSNIQIARADASSLPRALSSIVGKSTKRASEFIVVESRDGEQAFKAQD